MSGDKKTYIRYTPEQLAAVPSPHQREMEREAHPEESLVKDVGVGAIAGAVVGSVLGIDPLTGAAVGGTSGVAHHAAKKK